MSPIAADLTAIEHHPEDRPYVIREARTLRELDEVHRVTHDSIVGAGYMAPQVGGRIISYPALDPSPLTTILIAVEDGRIVGTNSVTADGPLGLHTDVYFPAETDAVRQEGRRLVSSFRIATDPGWCSRHGNALVLDLVKWTAFVAIHKYRFETMLCAFNPKHEVLYRRLLDATTIARREDLGHGEVKAGAVLMRIERTDVERKLGRELDRFRERYLAARDRALELASALCAPAPGALQPGTAAAALRATGARPGSSAPRDHTEPV